MMSYRQARSPTEIYESRQSYIILELVEDGLGYVVLTPSLVVRYDESL